MGVVLVLGAAGAPAAAAPPTAAVAQVGQPEAFTDALDASVFPGGHVGVWTVCPSGYGARLTLEWDGAYDTNEPGAYPPPAAVTRRNPGVAKRFTVLRVPPKLGNGRSTSGRQLYVRVTCASSSGALTYGNTETLRVVPSSGYPEVNRWKSATKPVRLRLSAPSTASSTSPFVVTIRAKNRSSKLWRGALGFTVFPTSETNFSLPALAKVTRSGTRVPARFLQSFPGGKTPNYRVVRSIKPGRTVTIRFRVVAGVSIYPYLTLGAMRGTVALGSAAGTTSSIALT